LWTVFAQATQLQVEQQIVFAAKQAQYLFQKSKANRGRFWNFTILNISIFGNYNPRLVHQIEGISLVAISCSQIKEIKENSHQTISGICSNFDSCPSFIRSKTFATFERIGVVDSIWGTAVWSGCPWRGREQSRAKASRRDLNFRLKKIKFKKCAYLKRINCWFSVCELGVAVGRKNETPAAGGSGGK
jgi:hypothetical protein